jgi:hypothetical protein
VTYPKSHASERQVPSVQVCVHSCTSRTGLEGIVLLICRQISLKPVIWAKFLNLNFQAPQWPIKSEPLESGLNLHSCTQTPPMTDTQPAERTALLLSCPVNRWEDWALKGSDMHTVTSLVLEREPRMSLSLDLPLLTKVHYNLESLHPTKCSWVPEVQFHVHHCTP